MSDHEGDGNELVPDEELPVGDGCAARFAAVEVLSGEEQWDLVWKGKGKILRLDEGENQWKERGQGDAKIMRNKLNPKRHMFLLRREGIGKLAAQHDILKGMNVKPHPQNDKFLLWTAVKDYSEDDEGWEESFLIKFPTKEVADEFVVNWNKVLPK